MKSPIVAIQQFDLNGLESLSDATLMSYLDGQFTPDELQGYMRFKERIAQELPQHPVFTQNHFLDWFSDENLDDYHVQHFLIQFAIFAEGMAHAQFGQMQALDSAQQAAIEDMMSEGFSSNEPNPFSQLNFTIQKNLSQNGNGTLSNYTDVKEHLMEGGLLRYMTPHYSLIAKVAEHLGMPFELLGQKELATENTAFVCKEMIKHYSHPDPEVSFAAAFAMEFWTEQGFWDQILAGLIRYKHTKGIADFPVAIFTWNGKHQDAYETARMKKLEHYYFNHVVNEEHFINAADDLLDTIMLFWEGLFSDRKLIH
jgi:hypothetical protein